MDTVAWGYNGRILLVDIRSRLAGRNVRDLENFSVIILILRVQRSMIDFRIFFYFYKSFE